MKKDNDVKVVNIHNEALEHFCKNKVDKHMNYLKTALESKDLKILKNVSLELANDSFIAGAMHLNHLVLKLANRICSHGADKLKITEKVLIILKLMENLKYEYKDYINTVCVYKSISILSSRSGLCYAEQEEIEEFNIEEEFTNEWKCLVQ